jgi:hypothetical protein
MKKVVMEGAAKSAPLYFILDDEMVLFMESFKRDNRFRVLLCLSCLVHLLFGFLLVVYFSSW